MASQILKLQITTKGNQLLANAFLKNQKITLEELSLGSGTQQTTEATTKVKTAIKKIKVSGNYANNSVIRIYAKDETADVYSVSEVGLYDNNTNLIAIYSQDATAIKALAEKKKTTALMVEFELETRGELAKYFLFNANNNFSSSNATTTKTGVFQLATDEEAHNQNIKIKGVTVEQAEKKVNGEADLEKFKNKTKNIFNNFFNLADYKKYPYNTIVYFDGGTLVVGEAHINKFRRSWDNSQNKDFEGLKQPQGPYIYFLLGYLVDDAGAVPKHPPMNDAVIIAYDVTKDLFYYKCDNVAEGKKYYSEFWYIIPSKHTAKIKSGLTKTTTAHKGKATNWKTTNPEGFYNAPASYTEKNPENAGIMLNDAQGGGLFFGLLGGPEIRYNTNYTTAVFGQPKELVRLV